MARPKIYTSVNEIEKDIQNYFAECDKEKKPYTVSGLAYALDMDRRTLLNYSKNEEFFPTIKKAKQKIEQQLEENALTGKGNPTFTIFNLKNNYKWQDKVEIENNDTKNGVLNDLVEALNNAKKS